MWLLPLLISNKDLSIIFAGNFAQLHRNFFKNEHFFKAITLTSNTLKQKQLKRRVVEKIVCLCLK